MMPPTSRKGGSQFIGLVKYYHDMWARRSHTVAPLTKMIPSKVKF